MPLAIKEPRRQRHLVQRDLITACGGYKATAAICLVAPVTVSKWMEEPVTGSGQDITVKHLQSLLIYAGENLGNLLLQNAVDELMQDHFLNLCFRRAYPEEKVFAVVELLTSEPTRKAVNQ